MTDERLRFPLSDDVHLRLFEESDAGELYRLIDTNRALLGRWMRWPAQQTADGTLEFIRVTRGQVSTNDGFQAAVVAGDRIAGVIGFHGVDWGNRQTSLGYWLGEAFQGQGTMTRAVTALVEHAFSVWDLRRVEIKVAPDNTRSRAIPERLGFRQEGTLRDAEWIGDRFVDNVVYAVLAPEWREKADGREFYDSVYGRFADEVNAAVRAEAFGEEIGQNSWLSADEHRTFFGWLGLDESSEVLEVASGSGGPALFMVRETGCRVTGVDLHDDGVSAANAAASEQGLAGRARFLQVDARERLPFDDGSFDALVCIDSINHMYERAPVLRDWHRVLRPGGRVLFTDPIIVTGPLRREEMVIRSRGMGEFVFTPPGLDEALLEAAGFEEIRAEDRTPNMAAISAAWREARARREGQLDEIEGLDANARHQEFLTVVERLARERRLSRLAFVARRPATGAATPAPPGP